IERVELCRRPILLALLRTLAESWPDSVTRDRLVASVFGVTRVNESHRVRLRVEIGRLRRLLSGLANVRAVPHGFELQANDVLVLAPPIEGADAALLALLADGAAWSSSALALALGASQRSVQRALSALERHGEVHSFGRARARRWLTRPRNDFATALLLPAPRTIE
ncbi:MAG TPA: helix-turn-helix domain-containing protein, partial [Polyangiales bacterium]|nr:helix-turn-helix domain-containing protein [Polyangiales bacterium]